MSLITLFLESDNLIEVDELKFAADGTFVNDATVTMTLKDIDGNVLANALNVTLSYVLSSNGKYQGILDSTVPLVLGTDYFLFTTATQSTNKTTFKTQCKTEYKSG